MEYYYDDPLKAAWMSRDFGINLQIHHSYKDEDYGMLNVTYLQVDCCDDGTADYIEAYNQHGNFVFGGDDPDDRYSGDIYVHPDSNHIFEPKEGDLLRLYFYTPEEDNRANAYMTGKVFGLNNPVARTWFRDKRDGSIDYEDHRISDHEYKIIQRNNKAFFMPEINNKNAVGM